MRAVVFTEFGSAPVVSTKGTPEPAPGEVRVRVSAASVNGFDLAVANGHLNGMMEHRFPVVLGKDFASTVDAWARAWTSSSSEIGCSASSPSRSSETGRSVST